MRATKAITNHTSTGKYHLCFFPKKTLIIHINFIQLNSDTISFINIGDLTIIGI